MAKDILKTKCWFIGLLIIIQFFCANIYAPIGKSPKTEIEEQATVLVEDRPVMPLVKRKIVEMQQNRDIKIQLKDQIYQDRLSPFLFRELSSLIKSSFALNDKQKEDFFTHRPHAITLPISKEHFRSLFSTWLEMIEYYKKHGLVVVYQPLYALNLAEKIMHYQRTLMKFKVIKNPTNQEIEKHKDAQFFLDRLYTAQESANILGTFPLKDVLNTAFALPDTIKRPLKNPFKLTLEKQAK